MVGQPLCRREPAAATLALGGFTAFAIGNAIGLSMLSGGSVRYRLYARHGLGAAEVAHMTVFASLSLGCACRRWRAGPEQPAAASTALGLSEGLLGTIAAAVLLLARYWPSASIAAACRNNLTRTTCWSRSVAPCACRASPDLPATDHHRAGRRRRRHRALLLPEAPPFGAFLLVYLLALAAGVLSHVPGGVGVFEAILLAAFADKLGAAPLAAALLLYRLIYVVLPLLVACCCC
jgi:phosphatidylglycerol lysyltransferase